MHSAHVFSSEKRRFFIHRTIQTLLGASFPPSSKLFSLLIYLFPSAIIGFPMFLNDSYYLAINVSGVAGLSLLLLLQLRLQNNNKTLPLNSESRILIESKSPKSRKFLKFVFLVVATYFYFFLTEAFVLETYKNGDISKGVQIFELVLIHIVTLTSAGSIFFKSPKEFASVLPDDRGFNIFSAFFMRPCYVIIILIVKISYSAFWYNIIVSIIYFSLLPLWSLGILGGLMNTFLWGIETINSLLFGDSFKIRFDSLLFSFLFNCAISVILTITLYFDADSACVIFYLITTLCSLLKSFELNKFCTPWKFHKIDIEYILMPLLVIIQVFSTCLGLFSSFKIENIYFDSKYQLILIILGAVASFFCVLIWLEGVFVNKYIAFKFWINCLAKRKRSTIVRKMQFRAAIVFLSLFLISISFGKSLILRSENNKNIMRFWVWSALLLRNFTQCWINPLKTFFLIVEVFIFSYMFFYFDIGNNYCPSL